VSVKAGDSPLLLQTDDGPTLSWRGVDFYPRKDPVGYARRKARVFSPLPSSLYYVPSLGLGHGLRDLLEAIPQGSMVLCVEAFQQVMGIALQQGLHEDPRLLIVRTEEPDAAVAALRSLGTGRFRRVVETPLCAGYRLAPETYSRIRRGLEQEIMRFWQNRLTLIALGSLQVRNLISNLPLLREATDFSALSTPLPVVVAGAGPSLEESLPVLAAHRRRFTLLAVDTALPALAAGGVAADIVLDIEAQAVNTQDFLPAPSPSGPILACDLSVHPSAPRLFGGRVSFFSSEFAPLRLWDRLSQGGLRPFPFPALGSVGVAATHAALRLTDAAVFLTGLDFSFPGGRTHARGSPYLIAAMERSGRFQPLGQPGFQALAARRLLRAADKQGRPVLTDRVMSSYRDALEAEARPFSTRVYDCGQAGLPLGLRTVSTEQFADLLACGPAEQEHIRVDRRQRFRADALAALVSSERDLLSRMASAAAAYARGAAAAEEVAALLAEADYAWAHFADEPEMSSPDKGFVARARVAALYYEERLRRIESIL
jgi:hypothetical protein